MGHVINKKITLTISTIIAILLLTIGVTFAYFAAQSSTVAQTIKSGTLSISFTTSNVLRTQNIIPIIENDIDTKATELNFSVKNTGDITGYFDISLTDIVINKELKSSDFKWRLLEGNVIKNEGDFQIASTKKILIHNISIEPDITKTYKLLVWLNETNKPQNEMQGKSLTAKVTVNSNDRVNGFALSEKPVLENTVENGVISNLRMYGNSVQNGTPTPNNPVEIQSVGERTKNLFEGKNDSISASDVYKGLDMREWEKGPYTLQLRLKEGKQIPEGVYFGFLYNETSAFWLIQNGAINSLYANLTISIDRNDLNGVTCYPTSKINDVLDAFDIFLVKGEYSASNIPSYEPYGYKIPVTVSNGSTTNTTNIYLDEPLRAIGEYRDYIDFESGKIVRKIANKNITASSLTAKSGSSTDKYNYYFITFSDAKVGQTIPILSNIGGGKLTDLSSKNKEGIITNTNTTFFIAFFDIKTLADAKKFVTDNNVYANYILATPTEESIELPTITTLDGTTALSANTTIQPSFEGNY